MGELIVIAREGQAMTTTTAVARGTGIDHASVIKLVRTYRADFEDFGGVRFEIQPFDTLGGTQQREIACLNEQQATLLMTYMRNNDIVRDFKRRLVKAFFEMARQLMQPSVPQTLPEALRLAADLAEQKANLEAKLALAAPKVEFAEAVLCADGTMLVRDVAKTLGLPVRKTEKALRDKGVILSNHAPAAEYVTKGYFEQGVHTVETKTKGVIFRYTARVTGRGVEFIRRFAARHSSVLVKSPGKGAAA